jgi:SAM-dependent methyltransferase
MTSTARPAAAPWPLARPEGGVASGLGPAAPPGGARAEEIRALERAFAPLLALEPCAIAREIGPDFLAYHAADLLGTPAERRAYLNELAYLASLVRPAGASAVDVGCGHGVQALGLAALGARRVVGFDLKAERVRGFEALARLLGLADRAEARHADFLATPPPPGEWDIVIANEVVSHIRDLDAFTRGAARALGRGGRLYVRDANNRLHPGVRRERRRLYRLCEEVGHPAFLARAPEHARFAGWPFREIRAVLVAEWYPELSPARVQWIAQKTRGLAGGALEIAARDLASIGRTPVRAAFPFCDPLTGYYPERFLSAFELARALVRAGLEPEIRVPYDPLAHEGGRWKRLARRVVAALGSVVPIQAWVFRQILVLGTKTGRDSA